jgi:Holliday junction resolvasome RuvABC endonuclease subunit
MIRVTVGVDPSLSNTGVAIIHEELERPAFRGIKVSHIPGATGPEYEAERIELMASRVWQWISQNLGAPGGGVSLRDTRLDVWFVLEGPITGGYTKSGKQDERAGLRWRLIAHFRRHGRVMLVNPKHVKKYWAGNANAEKPQLLALTNRRYPNLAMVDDNANDALILAQLAAEHRGHGLPPAAPQVDRSILPMIEWPPTTTKETE